MTTAPSRPNEGAEATSALASDAMMRRLLSVARALSATDDLGQVLSVIIDAKRDLLDAERATVFEFDANAGELFTTVAHGVSSTSNNGDSDEAHGGLTTGIRIPITRGIAGECARHRTVINVPDAYADPRFNREVDKQTGFRTRSILAVPLVGVDGELIGVAQILNKRDGPFATEDQEIAIALASQAAVAMKRARLLLDRRVREKLEREIEVARRLQQQTFPKNLPQPDGYEIVGFSEPADRTGGDAFDAVALFCDNARWRAAGPDQPIQGAMLLMADATGHGVGPALSVTQARSMLRMGARLGADLDRVARHMNEQLCEDLVTGRFITAWLGLLDARANLLHSVSAGQAPLLVLRAKSGEVENREADVLPLGIMRGLELPPHEPIRLDEGDAFIALSDGFYESANADGSGEQFGVKRVADIVKRTARHGGRAMLDAIQSELQKFTDGAPADDDRTALIVLRKG